MSMQYCEFCDKTIDTDYFAEHFHEHRNGMCEAEQEAVEFPVYSKDKYGFYKIISTTESLVITEDDIRNSGIEHQDYESVTHPIYDAYIIHDHENSNAKEFLNKFTNVSNHLIQISK